ncbi:MAG: hypothetical protein ACR2OZ_07000 [Verrucomicrobiales bacterium]
MEPLSREHTIFLELTLRGAPLSLTALRFSFRSQVFGDIVFRRLRVVVELFPPLFAQQRKRHLCRTVRVRKSQPVGIGLQNPALLIGFPRQRPDGVGLLIDGCPHSASHAEYRRKKANYFHNSSNFCAFARLVNKDSLF